MTVSSFNWQNFYDRLGGGGFFEAVKARARANYDYVLIDSRTGVSDTAGICSVQMPDTLVVCFTYNNQSIKGAAGRRAVGGEAARAAASKDSLRSPDALGGRGCPPGPRTRRCRTASFRCRCAWTPARATGWPSDRPSRERRFADLVSHIAASDVSASTGARSKFRRRLLLLRRGAGAFKDDAHDPKTVLAAFLG